MIRPVPVLFCSSVLVVVVVVVVALTDPHPVIIMGSPARCTMHHVLYRRRASGAIRQSAKIRERVDGRLR